MSGAASLAAAKRRRSGGAPLPGQSNMIASRQQQQQQQRQPSPIITPMQILEDHERRLREVESKMNNQKEDNITSNNINLNINDTNNTNNTNVESKVVEQENNNDIIPYLERIEELNAKYDILYNEYNKLKTFSMETNTYVLQLLNKVSSLREREKKDISNISNILTVDLTRTDTKDENIVSDEEIDKEVDAVVDKLITDVVNNTFAVKTES